MTANNKHSRYSFHSKYLKNIFHFSYSILIYKKKIYMISLWNLRIELIIYYYIFNIYVENIYFLNFPPIIVGQK